MLKEIIMMTFRNMYTLDIPTVKFAHSVVSGHVQFSTFKLCYFLCFSFIHLFTTGGHRDKRSQSVKWVTIYKYSINRHSTSYSENTCTWDRQREIKNEQSRGDTLRNMFAYRWDRFVSKRHGPHTVISQQLSIENMQTHQMYTPGTAKIWTQSSKSNS